MEEAGKIRQALKNSDQNIVFKGYKNKDFRNLNPTKMLISNDNCWGVNFSSLQFDINWKAICEEEVG